MSKVDILYDIPTTYVILLFLPLFRPVHGLIFLFRWIGEDQPDGPIVKDSRIEKLFFAKQVSVTSQLIFFCYNLSSFIYICYRYIFINLLSMIQEKNHFIKIP